MKFPHVLVVCAALALASPVFACLGTSHPGYPVVSADEQALIVWDPDTRTEHFIRRGSFDTKAKDFGFLVPTPAKPEIEESSDAVFDALNKLFEPPHPKSPYRTGAALNIGLESAVTVLEAKRVGGFDVAVLQATDSEALMGWLEKNGYEARASFQPWLKRYVDLKWIITAFKYAAEAEDGRIAIKPVRLSFHTDTPFFPYHEPEDSTLNQLRTLDIFLVSPQPMHPTLRLDGDWERWSNSSTETRALTSDVLNVLLPTNLTPKYPATVTKFHDMYEKRLPGDLFFSAPSSGGKN